MGIDPSLIPPALLNRPPAIRQYDPTAKTQNTRQTAKLERPAGDAALGTGEVQTTDTAGFLVRVTSIRKRLLDTDNLSEKYHVDCCRYAGLIPDDSPQQIKIETSQRKAAKGEAEETIVEVYKL